MTSTASQIIHYIIVVMPILPQQTILVVMPILPQQTILVTNQTFSSDPSNRATAKPLREKDINIQAEKHYQKKTGETSVFSVHNGKVTKLVKILSTSAGLVKMLCTPADCSMSEQQQPLWFN